MKSDVELLTEEIRKLVEIERAKLKFMIIERALEYGNHDVAIKHLTDLTNQVFETEEPN